MQKDTRTCRGGRFFVVDSLLFGLPEHGSKSDRQNVLTNVHRIESVDTFLAPDVITHARLVARDLVEANREPLERLATELYYRGESERPTEI